MSLLCAGAVFCAGSLWAQPQPEQQPQQPAQGQTGQQAGGGGGRGGSELGRTDTPFLPGQKWRVHDINRPHAYSVVVKYCSACVEDPRRLRPDSRGGPSDRRD
jgi:hypothetical protein